MNVILFGATGMLGQGVLREVLAAPDVEAVLTIGRTASGRRHDKLRELVHRDFTDFSSIKPQLTGYDACFFCLGVSSAGMPEADYRRVTYEYTLAAARTLARLNPGMVFVYTSAMGADSSEGGKIMWARVRGRTENALFALPFKGVYAFRPAFVQPSHGESSRTPLYRRLYSISGWLFPVLRAIIPRYVTTTEQMGRAMLRAVREGAPTRILESADISALGAP